MKNAFIRMLTVTIVLLLALAISACGGGNSLDNPQLYVANIGNGSVSVVDRVTGSVVDTITIATAPAHIGILPSLNKAYISDLGDNNIHAINTSNRSILTPITVSRAIGGLDVDGDGTVSVIDIASGTETGTITVGTNPF